MEGRVGDGESVCEWAMVSVCGRDSVWKGEWAMVGIMRVLGGTVVLLWLCR